MFLLTLISGTAAKQSPIVFINVLLMAKETITTSDSSAGCSLQSKKVVVFSKGHCPYCHKARAALETKQITPDSLAWVEIDERPDCSEIQDYLKSINGARSVPRVIINRKFCGGGDDTAAAVKNGKLAQLLKEAGAV